MSDGWRLMIVCDIQLVMGIQLLVWSDERLVLGNGWSMVSDRFIGNELLVNVDLSLVSGKSRKWWVISDGGCGMWEGWLVSADGTLFIVDSLWVTFEGDGAVGWWVIGDRSRIIDEGWWIFVSRVKGTDHHIGQWWTIVDWWWLIKNE